MLNRRVRIRGDRYETDFPKRPLGISVFDLLAWLKANGKASDELMLYALPRFVCEVFERTGFVDLSYLGAYPYLVPNDFGGYNFTDGRVLIVLPKEREGHGISGPERVQNGSVIIEHIAGRHTFNYPLVIINRAEL